MADFSKYSNYDEKSSFSSVVFGKNAPVLEVEMNELQQIVGTKLSRITNAIGDGIIPLANDSISFSANVLTLKDCVVIDKDGYTVFISNISITMSATNKYAYIKINETDATFNTSLKEYGNTSGLSTPNTIKDSRAGVETSRRKVLTYTLMVGNSVPSDTASNKYVYVGEITNGSFVFGGEICPFSDLGLVVDSEGHICQIHDVE